MHVQLSLARVADAERLGRQWERWARELGPEVGGWLGSTGGITSDGRFVLVHRFGSAEAARAGSERLAQTAWWSETEAALDGPPTVLESSDVTVGHETDLAAAGFVQVMRARVSDRARFEAVEAEIGPAFVAWRPDLLAAHRAWFPDGTLAAIDYFSSESEARAGEAKEVPDSLKAGFQAWMSLLEDTEWYDLVDPWHATADRQG